MADSDRFEYPLPSLNIGVEAINIETNDRHEGSFTIKNTGGGTLCGRVLSRMAGIVFSPTHFEGNLQTIKYTFDTAAAGLATGQSTTGYAYVTSNGGEVKLPITAKLTEMSITTTEGVYITNLQDFYNYALTHPLQAQRLFVDSEFYMLLLATGYKYIEVYESLHRDSNRERAIDNFFILSGLKDKTVLEIEGDKTIEFVQKPTDTSVIHGSLSIKKTDKGYIEAPITQQRNSPWINFYASRLIQSDFDDNLNAKVNFSIDPSKIVGKYARELVTIADSTVEIVYRRTAPIFLRTPRQSLKYDDNGLIEVANSTGKDVRVEVFCQDSYVRFSARSYIIGPYGEVPFQIKLSPFLTAQLFFRKLPYMKTTIEVKVTFPGFIYKKNMPIIVGEW